MMPRAAVQTAAASHQAGSTTDRSLTAAALPAQGEKDE